jgi:cobalt-zinc-cadmium efflux system outer membrane protein
MPRDGALLDWSVPVEDEIAPERSLSLPLDRLHQRRTLVSLAVLPALLTACAQYRTDPLSPASAILENPAGISFVRDYDAVSAGGAAFLPIDLSQPLTDAAVASLAVMANPDLKALRARAGVNDAQVYSAGLIPDPTISLGIDHILSGPDPVDALTGALGLDLNSLRTRAARRVKAEAERRQVRTDLLWAEWQTAGQARLQAVRIGGLEKQARSLQATAGVRRKACSSVILPRRAGATSPPTSCRRRGSRD